MKDCVIGIDLANSLRDVADAMGLKVPEGDLGFKCRECGEPVKPFSDGMQGPHFEHLKRNPDCSLSDT
jgi:hypothetical protein